MWAAQLDSRRRGAVPTAAVSSSDSLTRKTHPQNQTLSRQLSYSGSYTDLKIFLPHPVPQGSNGCQPWEVGPHHVWCGCPSIATD